MDPSVDAYATAKLYTGPDTYRNGRKEDPKQAMNPTVDACSEFPG